MSKLTKLALGAALLGGAMVAAAPAAEAGVVVGIGFGPGPGWHHNWCYYHPYRCGGGPGYVDGYYVAGRGYFWHDGWYGHRGWYHHGWRYWR